MKRNHYQTFSFLFKLSLLLNVYFHHNVTATSASISKSEEIVDFKTLLYHDTKFNYLGSNPGLEKSENILDRKQRPARLLPLRYIL